MPQSVPSVRVDSTDFSTPTVDGLVSALGFGDDQPEGIDESFEETVRGAIDDGLLDVLSLLRLINLDMQIATDTYVDSYAKRLEDAIERRKRVAREVEEDVHGPIEELHDASSVIAERAERMGDLATTQATNTGRAADELGELSAAIEGVATVADDVREESERTERLTAEGVAAAEDAIDELEAIEEATTAISRSADDLERSTDAIEAVLERLDAVAERTTILAKNAKIEAARADGTDAQTMTVLADEVESFAEETRDDLAAVGDAVEGVRDAAVETVDTTAETVDRIDDGSARVRDAMDSIEASHESARTTAARMEDVAAATDQQARNVERAAATVDDIAETADDVADAASSVAAASQQQTASLEDLGETVERLTDEDDRDEPRCTNGSTERRPTIAARTSRII